MAGITRKQALPPLGEAIRAAREQRGVSQRELGRMIGRDSAGIVSRWESGDRKPSKGDAQRIIEALELDGEEADELLALAAGTGQTRSFAVTLPERRAELAELLAAERTATDVTKLAPLTIPGVLQTADVIRTQMHEAGVPENEIEERVLTRIGRRDLITRRDPARLDVLLGEAAIRYRIGGPRSGPISSGTSPRQANSRTSRSAWCRTRLAGRRCWSARSHSSSPTKCRRL
jgi:transcriptional regulator with XRE-family HTH domain